MEITSYLLFLGWAARRWSFNLSSLRHCSSLCGVLLNDEVEVLALGYGVSTYLAHNKLVPGAEKARCEGSCYKGVGISLPKSVEFFLNFYTSSLVGTFIDT